MKEPKLKTLVKGSITNFIIHMVSRKMICATLKTYQIQRRMSRFSHVCVSRACVRVMLSKASSTPERWLSSFDWTERSQYSLWNNCRPRTARSLSLDKEHYSRLFYAFESIANKESYCTCREKRNIILTIFAVLDIYSNLGSFAMYFFFLSLYYFRYVILSYCNYVM